MLTLRHHEFWQRLLRKAWQRGALVVEAGEAFTSKIYSWDGNVREDLGSRAVIRDRSGSGWAGTCAAPMDLPEDFGR